ncbi:MAG: DUF4861 domain-containing protein [Prevotella sp.]|nr:DUF4861 domain-containing protein [Prevotella sp.]
MNYKIIITGLLFPCISFAQQTMTVEVSNPLSCERKDQPVVIALDEAQDVQRAIVTVDGTEVASQIDDTDRNGFNDELCFLTDLRKKEHRTYTITLYNDGEQPNYPTRTFAELMLRNPKVKEKNKHDLYLAEISATSELKDPYHLLHHHGIAFESELIAARIYFDKRQTLDMYGKVNQQLELKDTQFYTTAEQKEAGYGDDVLWVGQTYGLGAFRGWDGENPTMADDVKERTQRIIATGPLRTIVEIENRGWKISNSMPRVNNVIRYTLYAGHRDINVDVHFNRDISKLDFSTGIINVKDSEEMSNHKGLRACWGTDFPAGAKDSIAHPRETVGLAVYVSDAYRKAEVPANKDNYGFILHSDGKDISYTLLFASDKESFGFHSAQEWFAYLKEWMKEQAKPITIEVKSN